MDITSPTSDTSRVDGVYWVPTSVLPPLSTKIGRLQRRAAKLGSLPITFEITGEREMREIGRENDGYDEKTGRIKSVPVYREYAKVVVKGEAPKFNGWRLVARLVHPGQSGAGSANIINEVPGETCPKSFRSVGSGCDHCKKAWIYRRDTYVVVNERGWYRQVGANCIADFLGHQDPEMIASIYEFYSDLAGSFAAGDDDDDYEGQFRRGVTFLSTDSVLQYTAAHHRVLGWVSRALANASDKAPSIGNVTMALLGRGKEANEMRAEIKPTDADIEYAAKAREWAKTIDPNTDNTYLGNLSILAGSDTVSVRTIGFTASIISAYKKSIEMDVKVQKARAETNHVGTVGDKVTMDLRVVVTRSFEGQYGTSHMNRFADDAGNTIIWWTGTQAFKEGTTVRITGTIKKHSEYRGYKQTELTRCKELPNDEQAAILASLSPAAETLIANDFRYVDEIDPMHPTSVSAAAANVVPADEYDAAIAELEHRGWIVDEDRLSGTVKTWAVDADTVRTFSFAKARLSPAAKKAAAAARKAAKAVKAG
jgi:hypothetical protein